MDCEAFLKNFDFISVSKIATPTCRMRFTTMNTAL